MRAHRDGGAGCMSTPPSDRPCYVEGCDEPRIRGGSRCRRHKAEQRNAWRARKREKEEAGDADGSGCAYNTGVCAGPVGEDPLLPRCCEAHAKNIRAMRGEAVPA
jgi:hypothetical protein